VRYRFGKTVTYVSRSGKVLDEKTVKTRIKVGVPVPRPLCGTGENKVVDRVILEARLTSNPISLYRAFLFRLFGEQQRGVLFWVANGIALRISEERSPDI